MAKIRKFLAEVQTEISKASWPWDPKQKGFRNKYKELIDSTVVVLIAMILLGAFVSVWDIVLVKVIGVLIK